MKVTYFFLILSWLINRHRGLNKFNKVNCCARINIVFRMRKISHESGTKVTLSSKVLTSSLYGDTSSIRKFFAGICIYLRRMPCTQIIYFSPTVTQHQSTGASGAAISPADANVPWSLRIPRRAARARNCELARFRERTSDEL